MKRVVLTIMLMATIVVASAQELNIASYNVRNGKSLKPGQEMPQTGDYANCDGWDHRKQWLCDMINFEAFDIFGAQEVLRGQLDDMLAMLPDYGYVGVGRTDGADKGEFSPVFYRKKDFKLLDSGTFWLSETPNEPSKGWDAKYSRICTWGYFQRNSDKARFYFLSTHFDHRGTVARIESAKLIAKWIEKHCKGETAILVGDFNVSQTSDSYAVLVESGILKDTYECAKIRFTPTGTFNGFNPQHYTTSRIDHVFVTKNVEVNRYGILTYHYLRDMEAEKSTMKNAPKEILGERREVKCLSDHYAIQAFITLNSGKKSKR